MATKVADATLQKFFAQTRELEKRVLEGVLNPVAIRPALQDIITGKLPAVPATPGLFRSPDELLYAFVDRASERGWQFTGEQLDELNAAMPKDHNNMLSSALTLDIWLGDLSTTFEELWAWVVDSHQNSWRYDGLKSDPKHLKLLNPDRYGNQPSVKWTVVDLQANWDKRNGLRPCDVRDASTSAGLEILATTALHPEWIRKMDYETIPGVWLPGLQAMVPGGYAWRRVPILDWGRDDRGVSLRAGWDGNRHSNCAVPVSKM